MLGKTNRLVKGLPNVTHRIENLASGFSSAFFNAAPVSQQHFLVKTLSFVCSSVVCILRAYQLDEWQVPEKRVSSRLAPP
jgi:hypothetical protein